MMGTAVAGLAAAGLAAHGALHRNSPVFGPVLTHLEGDEPFVSATALTPQLVVNVSQCKLPTLAFSQLVENVR